MITEASPNTTPPPAAEPELITRARAGDRQAWAALYSTHRDQVFRYLCRRLNDRATAEDLTGDVFVRAMRRIETFTWTGRDFGAWLVTIARNILADHFKSCRFQRERPVADMLNHDELEPDTGSLVTAQVALHDFGPILRTAMGRLTPGQRQVLLLRFWQGMPVSDTARAMGMQVGSVKNLQHRAVRKLSQGLRGAGIRSLADAGFVGEVAA